ncbi:hypothetical protein Tco_1370750 [Tanacetum coccineum]
MHDMGKTVTELHAMLKLHEKTLPKKDAAPALHAIRAGKILPPPKKDNPVKDVSCHQCGDVRTIRIGTGSQYYRVAEEQEVGLSGSRKLKPGSLSLYVGDGHRAPIEAIGSYHLCLPSGLVLVLHNCHYAFSITRGIILVSRLNGIFEIDLSNSNTNDSSILMTQEASGSLEDLEIIQEEDTNPSVNTSLHHDEDDQEIDEPQSDVNPIRRSTRTRHAPDRMCLYIDAEENELGDHNEPANYKAALLDLESEK